MYYPQPGGMPNAYRPGGLTAVVRSRAIEEFLAAYPASMVHTDYNVDIYQLIFPSKAPGQGITVRITIPKQYPKDLPVIEVSPKVLPPDILDPSTGLVHQRLIIEVYQRKPSIAEILHWLKGYIEKALGGSTMPPASLPAGPRPAPHLAPQMQQQTIPTVPVKPVATITIEEPKINTELDEIFNSYSLDDLRGILADKSKLTDLYHNLEALQEPKKKLAEYTDQIRQKSIAVIELRNSLKAEADNYDSVLGEYESLRKELNTTLDRLEEKKSAMGGEGGVKGLLQVRMKKMDGNAQALRGEFKRKREAEGATGSPQTMKYEVDDFVKNYGGYLRDYHRCEILLNNLPH